MKKANFKIAMVLTLVVFRVSSLWSQAPDPDYILLFEENFDGSLLDTTQWYYRDMLIKRLGGYNKKENVSIDSADGLSYLKIDYNKWDVTGDGVDDLVGGGILSRHIFGYGYYEAKIKFYYDSKGFHQAFWTYGLEYSSSYSV